MRTGEPGVRNRLMPSARPILGHCLRLTWILLAGLTVAFCVAMQRAWHPTWLSVGMTIVAGLVLIWAASGVVGSMLGSAAARRCVSMALGLCSLVSLSPAAVRASMPWEDPADFSGSPAAVLIGLVVMTVFFGLFVGAPLMLMAALARSGV